MATCRDVIKAALRKINAYGGGNEPTADQASDALDSLTGMFHELAGQGVFGRLYPVIVTADTYSACPGQRIVCNSADSQPITITLPTIIQAQAYPGCCCGDNGAWYYPTTDYDFCCVGSYWTQTVPRDGACIAITDMQSEVQQTWIYAGAIARWIQLETLDLNSPFPFGDRYRETFAASLAVRIFPEYQQGAPSPVLMRQASAGMVAFCSRPDQPSRPVRAEYF